MRKLIKVTQDNINEGSRMHDSCPVALALIESGFKNPRVMHNSIYLSAPIKYISVKAPRSVRRFIGNFDQMRPVEPFNFYINI